MTDDIVARALADIAAGDWDALRLRLHPYLHWETSDGRHLRGRKNVLEELRARPPSRPPISYELRDGQIYRWRSVSRRT